MSETQCPDCQKLQQRVLELEAQAEESRRANRRRWLIAGVVPLVAVAVVGVVLTVWVMNEIGKARAERDQAKTDSDRVKKVEAESKSQIAAALAVRQGMVGERDRAEKAMHEAERSAEDINRVLTFLQNSFFGAPGRPTSWSREGLGKNITLRQAVDVAEAKVTNSYPDQPLIRASLREMLGSAYLELGETTKAVKQYERALALREAMLGPGHPDTVICRNQLAAAYRQDGHPDKASALLDQAMDSPSRAAVLAVQGSLLLSQKKPLEAEEKLRQSLNIRKQLQLDDWTTAENKMLLGAALLDQEKFADAEPFLLEGYEGMKKLIPNDKARITKALEYVVRLYTAWGKNAQAEKWQKQLEAVRADKKS